VPVLQQRVRFWDFASSNQELSGGDPDWTVGALMGTDGKTYPALDMVRLRGTPAEVDAAVIQTAHRDGRGVAVRWFQDPGQAGVYQSQKLRSLLNGFDCKGVTSQIGKQQRAAPLSRAAEFGEVPILKGIWNNDFLNELAQFPDGSHDDIVDSFSGAYLELTGEGALRFSTSTFA
jgi:predicted phage terminase large subunit-like protein